jgi:hypothetical protein
MHRAHQKVHQRYISGYRDQSVAQIEFHGPAKPTLPGAVRPGKFLVPKIVVQDGELDRHRRSLQVRQMEQGLEGRQQKQLQSDAGRAHPIELQPAHGDCGTRFAAHPTRSCWYSR